MSFFHFLIAIICLQFDDAIKVELFSKFRVSAFEITKKPRGSVGNWNPIFQQHTHRLPVLFVLI